DVPQNVIGDRGGRTSRPAGDTLKQPLDLQKGLHELWIEVLSGFVANDVHAPGVGETVFVDPFGGEGVVDIGNGHDPGGQGNLFAFQTRRIARAVPPLVVRGGDLARRPQEIRRSQPTFNFAQALFADPRVLLHAEPLFGR